MPKPLNSTSVKICLCKFCICIMFTFHLHHHTLHKSITYQHSYPNSMKKVFTMDLVQQPTAYY